MHSKLRIRCRVGSCVLSAYLKLFLKKIFLYAECIERPPVLSFIPVGRTCRSRVNNY